MTPHIRVLCGERGRDLFDQYLFWIDIISRFIGGPPESIHRSKENFRGNIGQLSTKEEAAGKIRVFAIVDPWTQAVLRPLHDYLFSFLKSLPNDGTFDQHASVLRCMEKVKVSGKSFGYDLSAATDRLPIQLQVAILSSLLGDEFAKAWKSVLVDREYVLRNQVEPGSKSPGPDFINLKYEVGQPMGALSS